MYLDAMQGTVASFSRRGMLGLGMNAAAAAGLGSLAGLSSAPAHGKSRPLDLNSAEDNIYAYAKTWGTLGDEPVFGGHEGVFFAVVGFAVGPTTPHNFQHRPSTSEAPSGCHCADQLFQVAGQHVLPWRAPDRR